MCEDCCYGEGGIFMNVEERKRIAAFLKISSDDFLSRFCEERNGVIYVKTGEDNFCTFYQRGKGCAIHPVKPARCCLWPYYNANVNDKETWDMAKLACRGINRECSFEEFVRQSKTAEK
jgi:Fe-S-cluster containining protein